MAYTIYRFQPLTPIGGVMIFAMTFIFSLSAIAQSGADRVERLKEEIGILEGRIRQAEAGRRGVIEQMHDLDRQIELRRRLIGELESQVREAERQVAGLDRSLSRLEERILGLNRRLADNEADLSALRKEVGRRVAHHYKYTVTLRVASLLSAASLNDLFQRRRYLMAIERFDRVRIGRLREKRDAVAADRDELAEVQDELTREKKERLAQLNRIHNLLGQRRREEEQLASERGKKAQLLDRISGDAELLRTLLGDRRSALDEIEREIRRLDERAHRVLPDFAPDIPFATLAGKLPWPIEGGKVITPFGSIKHPKLGTTTINPGVDLAAAAGSPVITVGNGRVTRITYLRGFGNTIIINHGKGYYTVYARLGDIRVVEGQDVRAGQVIGEVGESGAEAGLHFEVWANRNTQNPLKWLKR